MNPKTTKNTNNIIVIDDGQLPGSSHTNSMASQYPRKRLLSKWLSENDEEIGLNQESIEKKIKKLKLNDIVDDDQHESNSTEPKTKSDEDIAGWNEKRALKNSVLKPTKKRRRKSRQLLWNRRRSRCRTIIAPSGFCTCKLRSGGEMIFCEGPNCKLGWFHLRCIRMTRAQIPKGDWFCPQCRD